MGAWRASYRSHDNRWRGKHGTAYCPVTFHQRITSQPHKRLGDQPIHPIGNIGSLYRTSNGGLNWTRYDIPFHSGYIQFLDDNNGFVLHDDGRSHATNNLLSCTKQPMAARRGYKTTITTPMPPGAGQYLPLGGHKDGMTFRDTTTGWVGGDIPINGYFYLYKTTDSGVTWERQTLAIPAGYESAYITTTAPKFFGANDGILPVWMTLGAGMRDLFLYSHTMVATLGHLLPAFARNAQHTDIISMGNTISWDWANVFHVTNNCGSSWTTVTPNVSFGDDFRGLDFVSTTTGWVTLRHPDDSTSLYRTTDGGSTWTLLSGGSNPTPTDTPASLIGPYAVIRVAQNDVLNIRSLAGSSYPVVGSFPSDAIKSWDGSNRTGVGWHRMDGSPKPKRRDRLGEFLLSD